MGIVTLSCSKNLYNIVLCVVMYWAHNAPKVWFQFYVKRITFEYIHAFLRRYRIQKVLPVRHKYQVFLQVYTSRKDLTLFQRINWKKTDIKDTVINTIYVHVRGSFKKYVDNVPVGHKKFKKNKFNTW